MEEIDGGISEAAGIELKKGDSLHKPDRSILNEEEEIDIPEERVHPSSLEEVLADCLDSDRMIHDMSRISNAGSSYMRSRGITADVLGETNWDSGCDVEGTDSSNNITNRWTGEGKSWLPIHRRSEDDMRKSGNTRSIFRKGTSYTNTDINSRINCAESFHSREYDLTTENFGSECDEHGAGTNDTWGCGVTRTKMLSKSGFSEFFVKKTLEGKGITYRSSADDNGNAFKKIHQDDDSHDSGYSAIHSGMLISSKEKVSLSCYRGGGIANSSIVSSNDGVVLREWLNSSKSAVDKADKLDIFRQVLEITSFHHSKGVVLKDLRPSFFKLCGSNEVRYFGRFLRNEILDGVSNEDVFNSDSHRGNKRRVVSTEKSESTNFSRWKRPFFPGSELKPRDALCLDDNKRDLRHQDYINCTEDKWYASPDEVSKQNQTQSSNVYSLGVILFELLGSFNSEQAHLTAMLDLRHRILPPRFLSEYPLETGICLWLLHPEASSRPQIRLHFFGYLAKARAHPQNIHSEILQSEPIRNLKVVTTAEISSTEPTSSNESDSDLLLHFLSSLKEMKKNRVSKLRNDIMFLEGDVEEIERRNREKAPALTSSSIIHEHTNFPDMVKVDSSSEYHGKDIRLMMNLPQLETVYFSTRSAISPPKAAGNRSLTYRLPHKQSNRDILGDFFDGLCKYGRYTKFELCRVLRSGDFSSSSANVVCSLGFDRDEDYFAAAGISKKIKIFDFHSLFGDYSSDIHYPVAEMVNNSKISCICWNHYIKNFMASTDYDGIVKLWDVGKAQDVSQYTGHQKRVWSVDFSHLDPTKFVSGSDDYCVKLWSMNEKNCIGTIKNKANVCCVQFAGRDAYKIGFGSADFQTYIYDVRTTKVAWCVLSGHRKAVSYLKFLDHQTLVSASTDNTLRVWDYGKAASTATSALTSSLSLTGHTNLKNFVGLSVSPDGYIVCGSETNEVFSYYKSMPMPVASYKFGYIDPVSGKEVEEEECSNNSSLFVSSVCWRGKSDMVVAANSSGRIKVLKLV